MEDDERYRIMKKLKRKKREMVKRGVSREATKKIRRAIRRLRDGE